MNLYLISQDEHNSYDTYDAAIVCADNEDEARKINPSGGGWKDPNLHSYMYSWASKPANVKVTLIGKAEDHMHKGIVLASFNAG